jgi:hypothetical protein
VATVSEAWTVTPDATTTYSIDAQNAYLPVSTGQEAVTKYFNLDAKRHIMLGARGSVALRLMSRSLPMFAFTFEGLLGTISDAAMPTDVFTAWKKPLAINNANTSGFTLHGFAGRLYGLEANLANQLVYRNLVGMEDVQLVDRAPAGSVTIEDPTIADKNYYTQVTAINLGALNLLHGTAAGNQVHVHAPAVQLTNPRYENRDGIVALALAMRLVPNLGNDEIAIQAL